MSALKSLTQPLFEETPVGPTVRIPAGATPSWHAVVEIRAQLQCECAGQCGVAHTAGRCKVTHQGWHNKKTAVLVVAPKPPGLLLPLSQKAALGTDALMAWCEGCLKRAESIARGPAGGRR